MKYRGQKCLACGYDGAGARCVHVDRQGKHYWSCLKCHKDTYATEKEEKEFLANMYPYLIHEKDGNSRVPTDQEAKEIMNRWKMEATK